MDDHAPIDTTVAVVIVGAGPTGLAAANLLGQAGIRTLVLERNAGLSEYPKAITIDDEGLRICQAMGLANEMLAHVLPGVDAHYLSGPHYLARVSPTSRRNGYPLISTFHQPTFEQILLQGLRRFTCVDIRFQHNVEEMTQDEQGVYLTVRTGQNKRVQIVCTYLLACDGGKSTIRHALNIPLRRGASTTSSQRWLVVDCVEDDADQTAPIIFFCNARPAVTVPAPMGGRRWEFMLLPGEREEDLLNPKTIETLIQQARASQPQAMVPRSYTIYRQAIYTFHAAIAARFAQGRIFLLGDAAHMMPPFGGQGMNSGLRDTHNLCWKLALVLQGRAGPHLLETYHQERYPHAAQMILFSSLLGRFVMTPHRSMALLRDGILRGIVQHIPPLRESLEEMRVKPQPAYSQGFLLPADSPENRAYRGKLLPQPLITRQDGKQVLLDELLGNGFGIVRLYDEQGKSREREYHELWQRLGVRCVDVGMSEMEGLPKRRGEVYLLVRPDRYIMGAFRVGEADRVASTVGLLLQNG